MIRELITRFNRSLSERMVSSRRHHKAPIKVWFEPDVNSGRLRDDAVPACILGETADISRTGIGFIVPSILSIGRTPTRVSCWPRCPRLHRSNSVIPDGTEPFSSVPIQDAASRVPKARNILYLRRILRWIPSRAAQGQLGRNDGGSAFCALLRISSSCKAAHSLFQVRCKAA